MDINPLDIIHKVWKHSGVSGNVWMPSISDIGVKDKERFREGPMINARKPAFPDLRDSVDWYWTPAVSRGETRRIKKGTEGTNYPAQRAVWVDCDDSYDRKLLEALRPSYMWETSPGHIQAIWLLKEALPVSEFHRDGFIGMLTQAIGADKSGVDISQLLRVPGTMHHKREPFLGRVLSSSGRVWTRGMLLSRVAKELGFSAGTAAELGKKDTYGDRSQLLWKFARNAAELGLEQSLAFKMIKATEWNKWKDDPDKLKDDIERAYGHVPEKPRKEKPKASSEDESDDDEEVIEAWEMSTVDKFGPVIRTPMSWVLPDIIAEGACGLLVAAPKVGKTRIAIEIALGLATGRRPLGLSMRKPKRVGFLSLEDGDYLFAERISASLNKDHGRQKYHWDGHIRQDGKALVWEPPVPLDLFTNFAAVDLSDEADQQRLLETITKHDLDLVVIDTLSMAIGKANVSDQKDMYAILKPLKEIAKETKCAIMFIHHTRKRVFEKGETVQESILGATALHGWSDFIMSLASPEEDSDLLRLGVQTKRGNNMHYINQGLKIVQRPVVED
ncbi:RecA-like DNA recombinase [Microbacterium phage Juanyo]|nr:RecA-like DNA recombinase [Microbacterium phage Juanyo]